jgi:uncharacterized membrane protein HdeD (DUF308 family)
MTELMDQEMATDVARRWWVFVVRGLLGVLFAALAVTQPAQTLQAQMQVFALMALFEGIMLLFGSAVAAELGQPGWPLAVRGALGIAAGLLVGIRPDTAAVVLVCVIALWTILGGALELVAALDHYRAVPHAWLLGLAGVAGIIAGGIGLASLGAGAQALVWVLGGYAAVYGVLSLIFGFQLLAVSQRMPHPALSSGGTARA